MPQDVAGYTECHGRIELTTEKAVLIRISEHFHGRLPKQKLWIPRSCCINGAWLWTGQQNPMVADWWLTDNGLL